MTGNLAGRLDPRFRGQHHGHQRAQHIAAERPLIAIADVAGGDWPERCAAALSKLTSREDLDAQGIGVMLLDDIKQVFTADGIFSRDLIEKLAEMKERPWPDVCRGKPITERWLARKLAAFGIHSKNLRIGEEQAKGYELADFTEAFDRYLEASPPGIYPSHRPKI